MAENIPVFGVGDFVRIHPASDWFCRGIHFGTVVKLGRQFVHLDAGLLRRSGKPMIIRLAKRNIFSVVQWGS